MIKIGFWYSKREPELPDPQDHVNNLWDPLERGLVVTYLNNGKESARYRGWSTCRVCGCHNGSADLTDGVYLWPSGFGHYLEEHGVKPPEEFLRHFRNRLTDNERERLKYFQALAMSKNEFVRKLRGG